MIAAVTAHYRHGQFGTFNDPLKQIEKARKSSPSRSMSARQLAQIAVRGFSEPLKQIENVSEVSTVNVAVLIQAGPKSRATESKKKPTAETRNLAMTLNNEV